MQSRIQCRVRPRNAAGLPGTGICRSRAAGARRMCPDSCRVWWSALPAEWLRSSRYICQRWEDMTPSYCRRNGGLCLLSVWYYQATVWVWVPMPRSIYSLATSIRGCASRLRSPHLWNRVRGIAEPSRRNR